MVEIRVRRDDHGRAIPRCGACPQPHPDMQFQAEDETSELWECPVCSFTATMRKLPSPKRVILVEEFMKPN